MSIINLSDLMEHGVDLQESLAICRLLGQAGIDSIEISGNGTSLAGIQSHVNEGYFAQAAAAIAEAVSTPVMVVGGFAASIPWKLYSINPTSR